MLLHLATPRAVPPPPAGARTILLVDDEPDILSSYALLLQRFVPNVIVRTAGAAHLALDVLAQERVDLIIADYRMPGMDGIQFLQEARLVQPGARRVLLSAYMDYELQAQVDAKRLADTCVSKAMDLDTLIRTVRDDLLPQAA